jgi:hypothetical protein
MRPLTSTMDVAGRIEPKTSPCTRPTSAHRPMSGDEHPGTHHVVEARADLVQRRRDPAQGLPRLRFDVVAADRAATLGGRGRAGDRDPRPDAYGAGVADDGVPHRAGRHQSSLRHRTMVAQSGWDRNRSGRRSPPGPRLEPATASPPRPPSRAREPGRRRRSPRAKASLIACVHFTGLGGLVRECRRRR